MIKSLIVYFWVFLFLIVSPIWAIEDPLTRDNNKYGIHIIDENDLQNASALVNSSGGDWGYVTVVMTQKDRNITKWQKIFDDMYYYHLIPIVRLATTIEGNYWTEPKLTDASEWADFLIQLKWVTKNRYVIIFNEPNHAKEWGNRVDPKKYAQILKIFSQKLKEKNDNFFILPAGLDASAPNSGATMDEGAFLRSMNEEVPDVFSYIDGWTSHSYPNPGFTGKPYNRGRGTLTTYVWEKKEIEKLGETRNLPVFITETGWPNREGDLPNSRFFSTETIADFIDTASKDVWNDESIVALTPFVLNYQSLPFSSFSWQKRNSQEFYTHFDAYRSILKVAGDPAFDLLRIIPAAPTTVQTLGIETETKEVNHFLKPLYSFFSLIKFIYNRK